MTSNAPELTAEEVERLQRSMRDPRFRDMFSDYVDEISDPKHRGEQEQYMRDLETKGECPKNTVLLEPSPGVCARTAMKFAGGSTQKVFVNICYSEGLQEISFEARGGGQMVNIPMVMSRPRPDKDKSGNTCMTIDCVVGRGTFVKCMDIPDLLKTVFDQVCESMKRGHLQGGEEIMRDFQLLHKLKCKGGTPRLMPVGRDQMKDEFLKKYEERLAARRAEAAGEEGEDPPGEEEGEGAEEGKMDSSAEKKKKGKEEDHTVSPKDLKKLTKRAERKMKKENEKKSQEDGKEVAGEEEEEEGDETEKETEEEEEEEDNGDGPVKPRHSIIHQGRADYTNMLSGDHSFTAQSLCVKISLPGIESVRDADLSFSADPPTLLFSLPPLPRASTRAARRGFSLRLRLPLPVQEENSKAKFDKTKKVLSVTAAVDVEAVARVQKEKEEERRREEEERLKSLDADEENEKETADRSEEKETEKEKGGEQGQKEEDKVGVSDGGEEFDPQSNNGDPILNTPEEGGDAKEPSHVSETKALPPTHTADTSHSPPPPADPTSNDAGDLQTSKSVVLIPSKQDEDTSKETGPTPPQGITPDGIPLVQEIPQTAPTDSPPLSSSDSKGPSYTAAVQGDKGGEKTVPSQSGNESVSVEESQRKEVKALPAPKPIEDLRSWVDERVTAARARLADMQKGGYGGGRKQMKKGSAGTTKPPRAEGEAAGEEQKEAHVLEGEEEFHASSSNFPSSTQPIALGACFPLKSSFWNSLH
uniref:PIH1 domain-containing protein 1 n=1 Tax=Chromera velia CCMP2878 TaxID=1169474 RepID=A0A0G4HQC5_9ALVE|eukprot:Cvel_7942.t1-p1 / transcript=Cvel_7942.t1 / gene=Cvel_7942 / organism=Chromera_velia_CCMP2878 / gene_product=Protein kintoun, putative / transcript_product=Protein kintoun, putative / location=Cvel_scaffold426:57105-59844(-) / protein_length=757 / sequence_SO=supercontig / SO=protein_coding / is_pseudo=false